MNGEFDEKDKKDEDFFDSDIYENLEYKEKYDIPNYNDENRNTNYKRVKINDDVIQLIGGNSEYYMNKFQTMKTEIKKTSWNWPAFLCIGYWFIYRKMYAYGAILVLMTFLLSFTDSVLISISGLIVTICIGIYGNYIYMVFLEDKVQKTTNMSQIEKEQYLAKNSDVNLMATLLTVIGMVILRFMIGI